MSSVYSDINVTIIGGRLAADPEFHEANGDRSAFTKIVIASNKRWKGKDDKEMQSHVTYLKVYLNTPYAQFIAKFKKGDRLQIAGELKGRPWTDKDGKKNYDLVLIAKELNVPFGNKQETDDSANLAAQEQPSV